MRVMAAAAPLKLLVVDDHAAMRAAVRLMFEETDTLITEAGSGEEALRCIGAECPDWVVMDLRMPGMGGFRAAEAIRQLAPRVRVILMSQFHDPEFIEQARTAGAVEFLNKDNLLRLHTIIRPTA